MKILKKTYKWAKKGHAGQFRRDGVTPYFSHCEKVASLLNTEEEKAVAYCHDLLEDNRCSYEDLAYNVSESIANTCELLDKKGLHYFDYITLLKESDSKNVIRIKVADIVANLSDNPTEKQIEKYNKALQILIGVS